MRVSLRTCSREGLSSSQPEVCEYSAVGQVADMFADFWNKPPQLESSSIYHHILESVSSLKSDLN